VTISRLINRNISAGRGRTSMRLEPELWEALDDICHRERITMRELVRRIELTEHKCGRTSSVRVYIVDYFRYASRAASRVMNASLGNLVDTPREDMAHSEMVHGEMVHGEMALVSRAMAAL